MKETYRCLPVILSRSLVSVVVALLICESGALGETPRTNAPTPPKLTRTVGLDIVKRTENPDKTHTLVYRWKDKAGDDVERAVTVNGATVIVVDGELKKYSDLTEEHFRQKSVATVAADNTTAVSLRFGRAHIPKDKLTPAQLAALMAAAPPPTGASDAALEKRVTEMVEALKLDDPAKKSRVHAALVANLKGIRESHNAGLQPDKSVRTELIARLEADLTPEQVEEIKNRLTVNKLPVTFNAYHAIVPNLTPADDQAILALLRQAREESLNVKNPDQMSVIFERYKTQIEKYLNAQGYDWAKLYKAYVTSRK
jgi:hypothetical protein